MSYERTAEHREKMASAQRKRFQDNPLSEETKEKISKARLAGRNWPTVHRTISGVDHKFCKYCEQWLSTQSFYRNAVLFDGLDNRCKKCFAQQQAERELLDKEKWLKRRREATKRWQEMNPEKRKIYRLANVERFREVQKKWEQEHPDKVHERQKRSSRKRMADPKYRIINAVRCGVRSSLRGQKKGRSWEKLVGYSLNDLRSHLESRFQKGMAWGNYGQWQIDHKIPIAAFNFEKPEDIDFRRCWALENLQPMWTEENIRKKDKLTEPFQPALILAV